MQYIYAVVLHNTLKKMVADSNAKKSVKAAEAKDVGETIPKK